MLVKLTNVALDYAWGSKTLIPDFFGVKPTGKPMAEVWFGTHDGSPTEVVGHNISLHDLLSAQGRSDRLPFLMKILAAEAPLSIQAHPNPEQAARGFARENEHGLAISAINRNYKDNKAKPEMIVSLTESFEALIGFADARIISEKFAELIEVSQSAKVKAVLGKWITWLSQADGIRKVALDSLSSPECDDSFITDLIDAAEQCPSLVDLVSHLAFHHGSDRGIATALLLNHMILSRGEAVFVPAGMPHAYLSGLGVEVMVASDNVLRGGLTPKHIDVAELSEVLLFESTNPLVANTKTLAVGFERFDLPTPEFDFYRAVVGSTNMLVDLNLPGDAIVLCSEGSVAVSSSKDEREVINSGQAVFISGDARTFSLAGNGTAFIAVASK
ncbi:MAG: mannose-6-phosphate isomerase, class I [Micrococcales bacterium]|nr:mannose-6-phosphate isomerase, class I [Micrococcales bacterium]